MSDENRLRAMAAQLQGGRNSLYERFLEPTSERANALARMLGGFLPPQPRENIGNFLAMMVPRPQDMLEGSGQMMRGATSMDPNAALGGLSLMAMGAMDAVPGGRAANVAAKAAMKPSGAQAFLDAAFSTKGQRGGAAAKTTRYKSDFEAQTLEKVVSRGGQDADALFGEMARIAPFTASPSVAFSALGNEIITPGIVSEAAQRLRKVADFTEAVSKKYGVRPSVNVDSLGSVYVSVPGVMSANRSPVQFRFSDHGAKRTPAYLSVDPVSGNSEQEALNVVDWIMGGRKGPVPVVGKTKVDVPEGTTDRDYYNLQPRGYRAPIE